MKIFKLFILGLAFATLFAISIIAQTDSKPNDIALKVAKVDPKAFEDDKTGIKDLLVAYSRLYAEFKPKYDELETSSVKVKIDELYREILFLR